MCFLFLAVCSGLNNPTAWPLDESVPSPFSQAVLEVTFVGRPQKRVNSKVPRVKVFRTM